MRAGWVGRAIWAHTALPFFLNLHIYTVTRKHICLFIHALKGYLNRYCNAFYPLLRSVSFFLTLGMTRESLVTVRCGHRDRREVVPVLSPYQISFIPSSITLLQTQYAKVFKCPSSADKRVCLFLNSHKELIFILILFYFIFLLDLRVLLLIGPFSRFPSSNLAIVTI